MKSKTNKIVILGAGIAGLSAGYHLNKLKKKNIIFEKNSRPGGLLDSFSIKGFTFDHFIHLSFAKNQYVKKFFAKSSKFYTHNPNPNNYYKGKWLNHSPQNNLFPLALSEKIKIIKDFILRDKKNLAECRNYEEWLKNVYGNYFATNFPMVYTKKYWCIPAKQMGTKWVGFRMNIPKLTDMIKGALLPIHKNTFYGNNLRYPRKGGYRSFLNILVNNKNIKFNKVAKKINLKKKIIYFNNGDLIKYNKLISSIPLPELCGIINGIPKRVKLASQKLRYTSGILVSLGLKKKINCKTWFYIYDKEVKAARVHSPSLKSPGNAPKGCSSLQAEIYFDSKNKNQNLNLNKIEKNTINSLIKMGVIEEKNIVVKDIRVVKYANVTFDKHIYKNRKIVHDYLNNKDIHYIGRYGEWAYIWSDQAFLTGKKVAERINREFNGKN